MSTASQFILSTTERLLGVLAHSFSAAVIRTLLERQSSSIISASLSLWQHWKNQDGESTDGRSTCCPFKKEREGEKKQCTPMLGWHVYSGIDLKIPTRLPRVAIYITSPNLLTCCCSNSRETTCLDYPGNPQTKKIHYCSSRQGYPLEKREMGLKCQHLPRLLHIHQSLTSLAVSEPSFHHHIIFAHAIFQTQLLHHQTAHCWADKLIHPLPGEKIKKRHIPCFFTPAANTSPPQFNKLSVHVSGFIDIKSSTLGFSRINPKGPKVSIKQFVYFSHHARYTPINLQHGDAASQFFNHISGLARWASAVADSLWEPRFFLCIQDTVHSVCCGAQPALNDPKVTAALAHPCPALSVPT